MKSQKMMLSTRRQSSAQGNIPINKLDALQLPKKAKLLIDIPANISLTDRVMGSLPTSLGFPTARGCS